MSARREAAAAFAAMHGRAPDRVQRVAWRRPPRWLAELGRWTHVVYDRPLAEGVTAHHHPFARGAAPVLATDERGRLHVLGDGYHVEAGGIVDDVPPRENTMRNGSQLDLLGGLRPRPRRAARRARSVVFVGATPNPAPGAAAPDPTEFLRRVGVAGAAAGVFELLTEVALAYVPKLREWEPYQKSLAQGGLEVVLALLGHRKLPNVATGLGAAGVANAVEGLLRVSQVDQWLHSLFAPAPPNPALGVWVVRAAPPAPTLPAGAPTVGALPIDYRLTAAEACR